MDISLRIKSIILLIIIRFLFWISTHKRHFYALLHLLAFAMLFLLFPAASFSLIVSAFLLLVYISGTSFFVYQAFRKIGKAREKPDQWQITVRKCESLKKDIQIWFTFTVTISGIGLATMFMAPMDLLLPAFLIVISAMSIEVLLTVSFALAFWLLFFILMERYAIEKAMNLLGLLYLLPVLVGGYATVSVAQFFGLDVLQDFIAAFVPYLFVYYWVEKSIPDYSVEHFSSLDAELAKTRKAIETIKEEKTGEFIEERKTRLSMRLSRLETRFQQLEKTGEWIEKSVNRILEIKSDYSEFLTRMDIARKDYTNRDLNLTKKRLGLIIDKKAIFIERISRHKFYLTSSKSLSNRTLVSLVNVLSLLELAKSIRRFFRFFKSKNVIDFDLILKSTLSIGIHEASAGDIPLLCQDFDRITLNNYFPAMVRFQVNLAKYDFTLRQMSHYPCLQIYKEFMKAQSDLGMTINEFRKRIQERIAAFEILERDYPESYIAKAFNACFGIFGISALKEQLRSLNSLEIKVSARRMKLKNMKIRTKICLQYIIE